MIHVGAHEYRPEWLDQLEHAYRLIRELPGLHAGKDQKILVFESRELRVGRAARDAR